MKNRFFSLSLLASLTLLVALLGAWRPAPVIRLQHIAFDSLQWLMPRDPMSNTTVRSVMVDAESERIYGEWPWSYSQLGSLIDILTRLNAAAVVLDLGLNKINSITPQLLADHLPDTAPYLSVKQTLKALPEQSAAFRRSLAGGPVVLSLTTRERLNPVPQGQTGMKSPTPKARVVLKGSKNGDDVAQTISKNIELHSNLTMGSINPKLYETAQGAGIKLSPPKRDGIVRNIPLLIGLDGQYHPALSAEAVRLAQGTKDYVLIHQDNGTSPRDILTRPAYKLAVSHVHVPLDATGRMWLRPVTEERGLRDIPAWRLLQGQTAREEIAGRIVVIGRNGTAQSTWRTNLFGPRVDRAHITAQAIAQMTAGDYLVRPSRALWLENGAFIAGAVMLIGVFIIWGPLWMVAGVVALSLILTGVTGSAYHWLHLLLDPLNPIVGWIALSVFAGTIALWSARARRRSVALVFAERLSPRHSAQLAKLPAASWRAGYTREITYLYCVLSHSDTSVEDTSGADHEGMVQNAHGQRELRALIARIRTVILRRHGTIESLTGTTVTAFWNAPLTEHDHAANAADAAIEIREILDHHESARKQGNDTESEEAGSVTFPIRCGIGLATGPCWVGCADSGSHAPYVAAGKLAHSARQLAFLTENYGVTTIALEATARLAGNLAFVEIGRMDALGEVLDPDECDAQSLRIFGLVGDERMQSSQSFATLKEIHARMVQACADSQWNDAAELIDKCVPLAGPRLEKIYAHYADHIDYSRETGLNRDREEATSG